MFLLRVHGALCMHRILMKEVGGGGPHWAEEWSVLLFNLTSRVTVLLSLLAKMPRRS